MFQQTRWLFKRLNTINSTYNSFYWCKVIDVSIPTPNTLLPFSSGTLISTYAAASAVEPELLVFWLKSLSLNIKLNFLSWQLRKHLLDHYQRLRCLYFHYYKKW